MAKTQYHNKTVLHRLVEELHIVYYFDDEYFDVECCKRFTRFTENLYLTIFGTIRIARKSVIDFDDLISRSIFTTNTNSHRDEYCFDDTYSFNLPIIA
eukprot:155936_1